MACYSPVSVINPSKDYMRGIDKITLSVPCGSCLGCRQSLTNDWSIRAFCQMQEAKRNNEIVGFITLSYANNKLPHFVDGSYVIECFDSEHIRKFINTLRKKLSRIYGITDLKYLICSEYGKKTQRPHYHALFFCPRTGSVSTISEFGLHRLIKNLWNVHYEKNPLTGQKVEKGYGHVFPDNYLGGYDKHGYLHKPFAVNPDNAKAARYCAKYVAKDLSFYEKEDLQSWLINNPDELYKIRQYLPKHWQSQGFGLSLRDVILNCSDPIKYLDYGFRYPMETTAFALPQYIIRKLRYDFYYVDDPEDSSKKLVRRRLSDFGLHYAEHTTRKLIEKSIVQFKHDMSFLGLSSSLQSDQRVRELFNNQFSGLSELYQELHDMLSFHSVEDLAVYKICYKDVVIPGSHTSDLFGLSVYDFNSFHSNAQFNAVAVPFMVERMKAYHSSGVSLHKGTHYHESFSCFNRLVHFNRFDYIINILTKVKNFSAKAAREAKVVKQDNVKFINQSIKENGI